MKYLALCALGLGLLTVPACSSPPPSPKNPSNPVVVMDTSMGKIYVEIYEDTSPITAKNFLRYVDEKFYDGTIFHRVIGDFMIQGGGFEPGMHEKATHEPIKNEAKENGQSNKRGTIAMARTNDPDSATAQFFINVVDNSDKLDPNPGNPAGYAVFGQVLEGMDVVDAIKKVRTRQRLGHQDVPDHDVVILTVRRVDQKK
jgi:cyclophilin family peptidyl-prolyl cis-trans isomerase